jgi:succinate dehydrogenase / fumarate reductase cytochrome b subunit
MLLFAGAEAYNDYAHALHNNQAFLLAAEVFLYAAFIAHIYLAYATNTENQAARGNPYAVKQTKRQDRTVNVFGWTPDTTMFVTGAVVLLFLIMHVSDFKFDIDTVHQRSVSAEEPYDKAVELMGAPMRAVAYTVCCLFLGIHVAHGFASAFQSLGVNHPRYNGCIKLAALAFAVLVAVGFASFALWGLSQAGKAPASTEEVAPETPPSVSPARHP